MFCNRRCFGSEVRERAKLVLFPEAVARAESKPDQKKGQHLYAPFYAEKHGIKPGRKSVAGRGLVALEVKRHRALWWVKLVSFAVSVWQRGWFCLRQRHSAGAGARVILQTAWMYGKIGVSRSLASWLGVVARVARLTSALVTNC